MAMNEPPDPTIPTTSAEDARAHFVASQIEPAHRSSLSRSRFLWPLIACAALLVIGIRCYSCYQQAHTVSHKDNLSIEGSRYFINQIENALALLKERSPEDLSVVQSHVGRIREHDHSGMNMFADVPTIELARPTYAASVTWCASVLVHESWHMKLFREHPANPSHWSGTPAEKACNQTQLATLRRIGAPQHEIDHLAAQDGTHWDANGDGVYDWRDYEDRDW